MPLRQKRSNGLVCRMQRRTDNELDRDTYGYSRSVFGYICGGRMSGCVSSAGKEEAFGSDMRSVVPLADGGFVSGQFHRRTSLQI